MQHNLGDRQVARGLGRGLTIGPVRLATNLLLAPIAGYCDLAFRTVCREASFLHSELGGLGLACTDLLSPHGLLRGRATSLDLAATNDVDKPVGMQLYGSDPHLMAEGARWAVEHGATVVDINMGCPVDKVTKKDGGSKLLTDLSRAVGIARAVREELDRCPLALSEWVGRLGDGAGGARVLAQGRWWSAGELREAIGCGEVDGSIRVPVPLTCKMRLCWFDADFHAGLACSPGLACQLMDVGVAGVTVHGRTTEMKFSGSCIRAGIAAVVEAVARHAGTSPAIPVNGNGDVRTPDDCEAMLRETGCQGVMIGRGALSVPWLFRDCWARLSGVEVPAEPTEAEKIAIVRRYFDLMLVHRHEHYAMVQIRRRMSWFGKRLVSIDPESGRPIGCKPLKEAMRTAADPAAVHRLLDEFLAGGLRSWPGEWAEVGEGEG